MTEILKAFIYTLAFSSIAILITPWCVAIFLGFKDMKEKRESRRKIDGILPQVKVLLMNIYYSFGSKQEEKLEEEVAEFLEAINTGDRSHQAEELADILVVLMQFYYVYELDKIEVEKIFYEKINRTLARIGSGYYSKENQKSV